MNEMNMGCSAMAGWPMFILNGGVILRSSNLVHESDGRLQNRIPCGVLAGKIAS